MYTPGPCPGSAQPQATTNRDLPAWSCWDYVSCPRLLIAFGVRPSLELLSEAGLCPVPTPSRCLRAVGRTHVNTTLTACSHNWPEWNPGSGSRVSLHGACAPLKRCPSPSSTGSGCSLEDTETMALVTLCLSYLFFSLHSSLLPLPGDSPLALIPHAFPFTWLSLSLSSWGLEGRVTGKRSPTRPGRLEI